MSTVPESIITKPEWRRLINAQRAATPAHVVHEADEPRRPKEPPMNLTERAYGRHLDDLKAAGVVKWWAFNKVRLRIADGEKAAWYKPDFFVELADGRLEFHETKGFERQRGILALKVAAGQFPMFRFLLVKRRDGGWATEAFNSGATA